MKEASLKRIGSCALVASLLALVAVPPVSAQQRRLVTIASSWVGWRLLPLAGAMSRIQRQGPEHPRHGQGRVRR